MCFVLVRVIILLRSLCVLFLNLLCSFTRPHLGLFSSFTLDVNIFYCEVDRRVHFKPKIYAWFMTPIST